MRRIADLTPGSAKTDAKDAAALPVPTGFDLDLARQANQTEGRIRGLHTQIHPALEQVLGPWLEHDAAGEARPRPGPLQQS